MELQEIWKDISNYEGLYQISNLGRVKSLSKKSGFLILKERIMKPTIKDNGYYQIALYKNKKGCKKYIHRLVAEAFIPNPNNYPCINHKDYNKANNNVDNIEWCSYSQNNTYSNCQVVAGASKRIPVLQCDKNGVILKEWECSLRAGQELGFSNSSITACCRGRANTAYGYTWRYKN